MRHILFLLFMALTLQAIAQYPATGNKMRLGWQSTGDGLVYRGAIGDTATLDPSGLNNAWMLLDTANGNLYAYRAKAWRLVSGGGGSVSDTLTGEVKGPLDSTYIDTVANIIFTTTTDTTVGVGELEYNDTQGSLIQGLKGGNVTNVIGQQIHQRVTNATGAPLTKGTAVFLHGSQGNRITVRKALATVDSTSANTFGIVAESIANNQSGYVITEGLITNINTNALTEGAAVYLSPTVAGELTTTKPQAPQHTVYIGVCVKQNAGSGELFVKIRNGQELDELHDVRITSPVSNASLYYNTSESVWRDTTGAVLTSDTSVFARDFQISGTANRLAMFTGSNTVGNSNIYQDSVGKIGIGINPSYKFQMFFNNSVTGVQDTLMDLYSANWYPVGVRSRVSNQIANGSYAVIGEALNGHYQENVGVYGIATKSDISGPGVNIGVKGEVSGTYNGLSTASGATYGGLFINNVRKTLSSGNFNIGLRVITDSAGTYGIYQNGFGANYFQGNVGLNTTTPAYRLDVNGDVNTTGMYKKSGTDIISGTTNYIPKFTGANTVGNSQLFDNGTNIGIGDETPQTKLHISVDTASGMPTSGTTPKGVGLEFFAADNRYSGLWFGADIGGFQGISGIAGTRTTGYNTELRFYTNNTIAARGFSERMRIDASGNVGIGTASPLSTPAGIGLTLGTTSSGRSLYMVSSSDGNNGLIQFKDPAGADALQIAGTSTSNWLYGYGSRPLRFFTNATEVMRIEAPLTGLGNVGIHTSSPSRPLHVNANSSMIIPSGVTGTRPALGADGDIRFNSTVGIKNLEWYNGAAWREPVNAARSPAAALANRFSKFDANGLLDTSAILIQANNRIGIFNSPAAGDSALTVTGGIRATTGVRATLLNVNTSGTQVLSINNYSGNANVGPNNVFIGNGGQSTTGTGTQGRSNIGIGINALLSITVGEGSIGIGTNAMATRADTMQSNIAIGGGAMQFQGSAKNNDNTAIGTNALRYNRGGNYNVALGSNALTQNTAIPNSDNAGGTLQGGSNNFGLGFQSCYWNGTGLQNVGIGSSANYANRNGSYNIAIGGQALAGGTSAADTAAKSSNVAIGANSLEFLKGNGAGNSDENVAIGYHAGRSYGSGAGTNFTAGKTSVYIGAYTRANANTNENEVVIGYSAIGNGSNTTTIGNSSTTNTIIPAGSLTVDVMRRKAPVTVTGNHTVAASTSWLICNGTGTIVLTLPAASSWTGREIMVKTIQPYAVTSASSNVVPIDGVATGTAILPATDGAWCTLVSDGTNWIIMQRGT